MPGPYCGQDLTLLDFVTPRTGTTGAPVGGCWRRFPPSRAGERRAGLAKIAFQQVEVADIGGIVPVEVGAPVVTRVSQLLAESVLQDVEVAHVDDIVVVA